MKYAILYRGKVMVTVDTEAHAQKIIKGKEQICQIRPIIEPSKKRRKKR